MAGYLKLFWWTDVVTLASGTLMAGGLVLISYMVLREESGATTPYQQAYR